MVECRWIQMDLFLILVLLFTGKDSYNIYINTRNNTKHNFINISNVQQILAFGINSL